MTNTQLAANGERIRLEAELLAAQNSKAYEERIAKEENSKIFRDWDLFQVCFFVLMSSSMIGAAIWVCLQP